MIINSAHLSPLLAALGIDPAAGGYQYDGSDLSVPGLTDADLQAALATLDTAAIDAEQLVETRNLQLEKINAAFQSAMDGLVAGYPEREIDSWPQQEREARVYAADSTASTPLIDAQAAARGWTKQQLVDRIILKADQFAAAAGALIGKRQALEDAVNAAQTVADVEAIVW